MLMGEIGQPAPGVIQRWRHGLGIVQVDPGTRDGNLPPEVLDDRSQGGPDRTGDHEKVGVGNGRGQGPSSPGQFGFERQARGGGPHRRHHQDVRPAGTGS